jgi:hypothetical protein
MTQELPRRSTGNVMEPGDGFIKPGVADLSPAAGYKAARPVQYSDESDTVYKQRLAEFDLAKLHAEQNAAGGATVEQQKTDAKLKYEAEVANIDQIEALRIGKPVAKPTVPVTVKPATPATPQPKAV